MKRFSVLILLLSAVIMFACTKDINFKIPTVDSKIVVEGWIEQGKYPTVIVTRSSPYFQAVDSTTLSESIIYNAIITVSDGSNSKRLGRTINPNIYPFFMYTDTTHTFVGHSGGTYSLTVVVDGKTYTAQTTIPDVLYLDSTWFALDVGKDSLGYVYGRGLDPGATADYYRVYTERLHKDLTFIPIFGSVWDDKFFNGVEFTFIMYRGEASNIIIPTAQDIKNFGYYTLGDTVITKLCHIDETSFKFWYAAERETFAGDNPFSSTTTIPTNIQGGALGVWWGLGASYDTVVCKVSH